MRRRGGKNMRQSIPAGLVVVLIAAAFAAGYVFRAGTVSLVSSTAAGTVSQASPSPAPASPGPSQKSGAKGDKATVTGTIESISNATLVIRVTQAAGLPLQPGASLTAELQPKSTLLAEITRTDLKRGHRVILRGSLEGNKFTVRDLILEAPR